MPVLKVAAAQIQCRPGDVPANLALHHAAIEAARREEVDLLVFPELSLTDYLAASDLERLARLGTSAEITELARAAGPMTVSVGFIEKAEGRFYNAQGLLRGGEVLHVHRKANLPSYGRLDERRHYAGGARVEPVALAPRWTAATLICADTWNPTLPWLAALRGASLFIVPVASCRDAVDGFDNPGGWEVNLRHTALTYGLPVVMANHCGTRGSYRFWGGSRVLDPFGREVARAGEGPALVMAEIDHADVERARARLPTIRDADPDLVHAELGRWLGEKRSPR